MGGLTNVIEFYRGDSKIINVEIVDENGSPVDLRDSIVRFIVKPSIYDPDEKIVLEKSNENLDGIELVDPLTGHCAIHLEPLDTKINAGKYVYEIKINLPSGEIYTVAQGELRVKEVVRLSL